MLEDVLKMLIAEPLKSVSVAVYLLFVSVVIASWRWISQRPIPLLLSTVVISSVLSVMILYVAQRFVITPPQILMQFQAKWTTKSGYEVSAQIPIGNNKIGLIIIEARSILLFNSKKELDAATPVQNTQVAIMDVLLNGNVCSSDRTAHSYSGYLLSQIQSICIFPINNEPYLNLAVKVRGVHPSMLRPDLPPGWPADSPLPATSFRYSILESKNAFNVLDPITADNVPPN